jgi:Transposase DDE domain group 1
MPDSTSPLELDLGPSSELLLFSDLGPRKLVADFSGGSLSTDGGMLLLRQIDEGLGISRELADCFCDHRSLRGREHSVRELVAQRVLGIAAGYEDLNDHNRLRLDPLFAAVVGKRDPSGRERRAPRDKGKALAGASTLNRLEVSNVEASSYDKFQANHPQIEATLLRLGVRCLPKHLEEVIIDLDATDDPLHGRQEGRFYNAFYENYCYLPLLAFAGSIPLWAQLRSSDSGAAVGALAALQKIVAAVRQRCPQTRIIFRADSGFCNDELMSWCETKEEVYYCLGLSRNSRLLAQENVQTAFARVRERAVLTGGVSRSFTEFTYSTRNSWSRARRVIAKAEVLYDKENPRFIVTNLPAQGFGQEEADRFLPENCYEKLYCARGDMENQIKQQYLDLEADRTSSHWMASNQLRLWFSTFALLLVERLRSLALQGTELARATAGSIRVRLLKIAAQVTVSTRRVYVRFASAFPLQRVFAHAQRALLRALLPQET